MSSLSLAAIGRDRPGIVAAVSRVLYELGCNLEDSSMTLLRGNFSMMLVFTKPDDVDAATVEERLRPACEELGMTYLVRDVSDTAGVPSPTHVLTVYGADRAGILFRTCEVLADVGANITDLNSRLIGDDEPVYAVMLELEIPATIGPAEVDGRLRSLAVELGVDVVLREQDADVL